MRCYIQVHPSKYSAACNCCDCCSLCAQLMSTSNLMSTQAAPCRVGEAPYIIEAPRWECVASSQKAVEVVCPQVVPHKGENGNPQVGFDPVTVVQRLATVAVRLQHSGEYQAWHCCHQPYQHVAPLIAVLQAARVMVSKQSCKLQNISRCTCTAVQRLSPGYECADLCLEDAFCMDKHSVELQKLGCIHSAVAGALLGLQPRSGRHGCCLGRIYQGAPLKTSPA